MVGWSWMSLRVGHGHAVVLLRAHHEHEGFTGRLRRIRPHNLIMFITFVKPVDIVNLQHAA